MKSFSLFGIVYISIGLCVQNSTDRYLHQLDVHHQIHHSCVYSPANIHCGCDLMCSYYDNCCYDSAAITGEEVEETIEDAARRQYLEMTTCEMISFKESTNIRQGAFMVSSCPDTWAGNTANRKNCEQGIATDVRDMLPVLDTKTNVTFKNRQCAKCHKIQNYISWLLEITCMQGIFVPSQSLIETVMARIQSDRCSYRFKPPNITIHYCYEEFDYAISATFNLQRLQNSSCRNRIFKPIIVEISGKKNLYFRNLQCLIDDKRISYPDILNITHVVILASNHKGVADYPTLRSLIDFSSIFYTPQEKPKCSDNEIQISDEVGCQRLYCPAQSEPSGGECTDIKHTSDGYILDLLFEANKSIENRLNLYRTLISPLETYLQSRVSLNLLSEKSIKCIPGTQVNSNNECSIIQVHIGIPADLILQTGFSVDSQKSAIVKFFENHTQWTSYGNVLNYISDTQTMTCQSNASISDPFYFLDLISVDNDLPCPAMKLQYSRNQSSSDDLMRHGLNLTSAEHSYFHLSGIIFSPSDMVFANGEYFLCVDTFLSKYHFGDQWKNNVDSYRSVINTVCISISIICMVYGLIQYCTIPTLNDGKSDLIIVLVCFLLLAQSNFLILSHFAIPSNSCEYVGIIQHYIWLSVFVFTTLSSYRLNADIRCLQVCTRSKRAIVTVKYVLLGFSVPFVIVFCTKALNLCLAPNEKWYGGRICFISQTYVMLCGFAVPVFLFLCGNFYLFISIIHYISATSISVNSNKSNVIVFLKISTIMGFSWIIGIVSVLSQSDVLLLIFEVLSNLQGAFITITFSCNYRVRKFYKECVQQN